MSVCAISMQFEAHPGHMTLISCVDI